ncbi:hypothetical protein HAX54_029337 [Datura stramonium]|uniref:Uncharacterized protein n=1 Tax=Datura stramonium TaxID=4076 RepID=A0ABS8V605_DATST|nr:hypothetical protein [Datura stramonium]
MLQTRVQIKYPEVTERGRQFLSSETEQPFHVYPEADMLLSMRSPKSFSSFAEWGKGWADPEIRRQRLQRKRSWKSPRKRKSRKRFSASFLLYLPNLRRKQSKQIAAEKLRIITEALDQAEDRVLRYEERHDKILNQICSHYIVSREIVEALAGAREAMNEALEFTITLRNLQVEVIRLYPSGESACRPVWLLGNSTRQRNNN